jgi:hypothetical protein
MRPHFIGISEFIKDYGTAALKLKGSKSPL